jgi:antitoxin component of MazEF toxin-antitoxin module
MTTKIQKWGNSLAVRLPKEVAQNLTLQEGSEVVIREGRKQVIIEQVPPRTKGVHKIMWKDFVIPTDKEKENVSGAIDHIVYGTSSR